MLVIMFVRWAAQAPARVTQAQAPLVAPTADRVRDYQGRLRALEAQSLSQMSDRPAGTAADPPVSDEPSSPPPADPIQTERRRREYESLFASNVVLSRRPESQRPDVGGSRAGARNDALAAGSPTYVARSRCPLSREQPNQRRRGRTGRREPWQPRQRRSSRRRATRPGRFHQGPAAASRQPEGTRQNTSQTYELRGSPIGCHADGRPPVFVYLVRGWDPFDFRMFLQRHGPLLRALAEWRIRLVIPPHLAGAEERFQITCWNELATPLASETLDELRWYFERRRELGEAVADSQDARCQRAHVQFSAPRFRALYVSGRIWVMAFWNSRGHAS